MTPRRPLTPDGYEAFLRDLKARIRLVQVRAALAVNAELVLLYWRTGRDILERQTKEGWGAQVIDRLSADLRRAFPDMQGFSARNMKYMRAFAIAWPDEEIVQQLVALLPWGHNVRLLEQVKNRGERVWYAQQAIEHGWSRSVLVAQIETGLHRRAGKALTNFKATLPPPQSDLARGATAPDRWTFPIERKCARSVPWRRGSEGRSRPSSKRRRVGCARWATELSDKSRSISV
jgi:predicted nuclease of restriction endonuclease-like (RecB) superfamily